MQDHIYRHVEGARPILTIEYRGPGIRPRLSALLEEQVRAEPSSPGGTGEAVVTDVKGDRASSGRSRGRYGRGS